MGVLFGYYAAADDRAAAGAIERDDDEAFGVGYDGFVVKGVDPMVNLLPAEALLTGRSPDEARADPRHTRLLAMVGDGEVVAVTLADTLRDALAAPDDGSLAGIAVAWSGSDAFADPAEPDHLAVFLRRLAALARRAAGRGHRLYCWICV
ncbi:hypothetical protein OG535_27800 [Kitasatospora sp. NBC_00085]|uniref:hypothetical protein n=1 Tax=unclassified Kitasatospora TaxID=2633591 RepID=UPI003247B752